MFKAGWTQRSNVSCMVVVGGGTELITILRRKQMAFLGRIIRAICHENLKVMGSIAGIRSIRDQGRKIWTEWRKKLEE